jgi:hypothetical protein
VIATVGLTGCVGSGAPDTEGPGGNGTSASRKGSEGTQPSTPGPGKLSPDTGGDGGFGTAIAIDGTRALIGAIGEAYVFEWTEEGWRQEARLTVEGRTELGRSVALSGDRALLGAPGPDPDDGGLGVAYLFTREDGEWSQTAVFTAHDEIPVVGQPRTVPDVPEPNNFGAMVALQGDTAVIGDTDPHRHMGSVHVFAATSGEWSRQAKLFPDDSHLANFGWSIAIEGDKVLVGGEKEVQDTHTPGTMPEGISDSTGVVYPAIRSGGTWTLGSELSIDPTLEPVDKDDYWGFGTSLALSGSRTLIGAPNDKEEAYVYTHTGDDWTQDATLRPPNQDAPFAGSLALDGTTAYISTGQITTPENAGATVVFERVSGSWNHRKTITPDEPREDEAFGSAVALDGQTALTAAAGSDSVYVDRV